MCLVLDVCSYRRDDAVVLHRGEDFGGRRLQHGLDRRNVRNVGCDRNVVASVGDDGVGHVAARARLDGSSTRILALQPTVDIFNGMRNYDFRHSTSLAMVRRRLGRTDTSHTTLVVATLPAIMGKRERSPAHAADQGVPDARQDSVERVACFRGNAREKAAVRPAVEGYATSPRMARIATRLRSAQT